MTARYFGIDIHKDFATIAAVDGQQKIVQQPVTMDMSGLQSWAASHLKPEDEVALEVTNNAWHVYDLLVTHAGQVVITNPAKTKLIAQARIKSDKVDALVLAQLLASRFICDVWVPNIRVREHRTLAAHRATLRKQCTQIKNRVHALLHRHSLRCPERSLFTKAGRAWLAAVCLPPIEALQLDHLLRQLDLLEQEIGEADHMVACIAHCDPRTARLMQIPGIGVFTAFAVLSAIGDIRRFPSPKKLAAYAGLVPSLHQSGHRSYSGHITKTGRPILRWLMVEAAKTAAHWDPHWRGVFDNIRRRRGHNIATVALARKLLVVIWHLLYHQSAYYYLRPQSFARKLQEWACKIGQEDLPASSTREFARQQLETLGLRDLAANLTSNRNGRLSVQST